MNSYWKAFFLCLGLLFFYSLARLLFLYANPSLFSELSLEDILASFALGIPFDLAAIAYLNAPFLLIYLFPKPIPLPKKVKLSFLGVWALFQTVFIWFNCLDAGLYKYRGKRLTVNSFELFSEVSSEIVSTMAHYWQLWLLGVSLMTMVLSLFYALTVIPERKNPPFWPSVGLYLAMIGLLVICARGGLSGKPLIPANAYQGGQPKLAQLVLNSSFTILRSSRNQKMTRLDFYPDWPSLRQKLPQSPRQSTRSFKNAMVIIVESLNQEYLSSSLHPDGFAPFIKKLQEEGHTCNLSFANGRRSIEAMTAIFAGLPNLMDDPLISSPYQTNTITGLPHILQAQGFQTLFFHGGHNGTMFFDAQAHMLGFQEYVGESEYPLPGDRDGHWGVYDEPFLQYTAKRLKELQEPFFAGIFTLSSHFPYSLPKAYRKRFPKGSLDIHQSIGYADYSLEKFFESIESAPFFEDTLFVITGDHTSLSNAKEFKGSLGSFQVPIIYYGKNLALPSCNLTQHIDIQETVLDLLGAKEQAMPRFGQSLLAQGDRHALLYLSPISYFVTEEQLISYAGEEEFKSYLWQHDPELENPIKTPSDQLEVFKAKLQYYRNGLIDNRLNEGRAF